MSYNSFTEMPVWQKAHKVAIEVYNITINLPRSEDYGLTSQIRRSSNGAAACIAEGFGRSTKKDKSNFYIIARGSSFELKTIFYMAIKLDILIRLKQISYVKIMMN